ncbi:hypothetical protein LY78DRAFT_410813 [Colletotrichum sublineola]|nr:hypothetical protein LY78DRAFT_410813 [Colletotrichum sublineola]
MWEQLAQVSSFGGHHCSSHMAAAMNLYMSGHVDGGRHVHICIYVGTGGIMCCRSRRLILTTHVNHEMQPCRCLGCTKIGGSYRCNACQKARCTFISVCSVAANASCCHHFPCIRWQASSGMINRYLLLRIPTKIPYINNTVPIDRIGWSDSHEIADGRVGNSLVTKHVYPYRFMGPQVKAELCHCGNFWLLKGTVINHSYEHIYIVPSQRMRRHFITLYCRRC